MNLTKLTIALVLSMTFVGAALADHEGYDMQQGAISGGPGTMEEDQNVRQSTTQESDDLKKQDDNKQHGTEKSEPVLPVPMH